jgi:hypothetical protein
VARKWQETFMRTDISSIIKKPLRVKVMRRGLLMMINALNALPSASFLSLSVPM